MSDSTYDGTHPSRRGILVTFVTIGLSVIAAILVQPRVSHWLDVRAAYRHLSHQEQNERTEAVRWLIGNGESPDEALITLLRHPDEEVRISAASALALRLPVTERTIDVFLAGLESDSFCEGIARLAPSLFYRHSEQATGPITPTERRMIAWLLRRLASEHLRGESEGEGYALSTFLPRDPTLMAPLRTYLNGAKLRAQISVVGQMAKYDPAFRDEYVQLLLSGASQSVNRYTQSDSIFLLKELQRASAGFVAELEARRQMTGDLQEASRLDRAIEMLKNTADQEK